VIRGGSDSFRNAIALLQQLRKRNDLRLSRRKGGVFSDLQAPQESLQASPLERYEGSALRRDAESALFAISLGFPRHHQCSKEALQAVLDARCIIEGSIQEEARWPTECQVTINAYRVQRGYRILSTELIGASCDIPQVIPERIRHVEYTPVTPEAFYVPTGREPRPKPISDDLGTVIFRYCPTNVTNYVSRKIFPLPPAMHNRVQ